MLDVRGNGLGCVQWHAQNDKRAHYNESFDIEDREERELQKEMAVWDVGQWAGNACLEQDEYLAIQEGDGMLSHFLNGGDLGVLYM